MSRLTLIRGLPGSGKTTFAKEKFPGVFHIENDMFWQHGDTYRYNPSRRVEAEKWVYGAIRKALEHGIDVVTSCVYGCAGVVDKYAKLANYYGADFKVYRLEGSFGSIHDIPSTVLDQMRDNFEDYDGEEIVYQEED